MIKISDYKRVSIKFGIVCGMVVTLCGAINAILGVVHKWNETFDIDRAQAEEVVLATFDEPTWKLEQRISGEVPAGTTITKGITIPEDSDSKENDEEFTEDFLEDEPVSMSMPPEEDMLSASGWLLVTLGGGGMMIFLMIEHKKDTLKRIKDDKEPDNIV
jgi:hypothetical protein